MNDGYASQQVRADIEYACKRADGCIEDRDFEGASVAYLTAIEYFHKLPQLEKEAGAVVLIQLLQRLASVLDKLNQLDEASKVYSQGIAIAREFAKRAPGTVDDKLALLLSNYGNTLTSLRDFDGARSVYQEAIAIRQSLARQYKEMFEPKVAKTLSNFGNMLRIAGDAAGARDNLESALALLRSQKTISTDPELMRFLAETLEHLSATLIELSELDTALRHCRQSVDIRRTIGDRPGLAESLRTLADLEEKLGRYEAAVAAGDEAAAILMDLARLAPVAYLPMLSSVLTNLGNILSRVRRFPDAERAFQVAIDIRRSLLKSAPEIWARRLGHTLGNYGSALKAAGSGERARAALEESLSLFDANDTKGENPGCPDLSLVLHNLGTVYCEQHRMEEGRSMLMRCAQIRRRLAKTNPFLFEPVLAKTLGCLATTLGILGDHAGAKAVFTETLVIQRRAVIGGSDAAIEQLAVTLNNYGNLLFDSFEPSDAVVALQEAVACERRLAERVAHIFLPSLSVSLHNLGSTHALLGDFEAAIAILQEAVDIRTELAVDNRKEMQGYLASSQAQLGKLHCETGSGELGTQLLTIAVNTFRELEESEPNLWMDDRVDCFTTLGQLSLESYRQSNDIRQLEESHRLFMDAVELGESLRYRLLDPEQRRRTAEQMRDASEMLVQSSYELWLRSPQTVAYLNTLVVQGERSRSRSLADAMQDEHLPRNTPDFLLTRLSKARARVKMLAQLLYEASKNPFSSHSMMPTAEGVTSDELSGLDLTANIDQLKAEYYAASDEYRQVVNTIRQNHDPFYDADNPVTPVSVYEIQKLLPDDSTAGVQFTLTANSGFAVVITRGDIGAVSLPECSSAALFSQLHDWFKGLARYVDRQDAYSGRELSTDIERALESIVDATVREVASRIPEGIKRLIIAPHQALHVFPLHASKIDGEQRLCDLYEVVVTPSFSILHRCAQWKRTSAERLMMIDVPSNLDFQSAEVARIKSYFSAEQTIDFSQAAAREELLTQSQEAEVWHYPSHAHFEIAEPLDSVLEFGNKPDDWFRLRDVFVRMYMPRARLVTLSACGTGMQRPDVLDEFVGFPTGFLYAGAQAVVNTLWPVDEVPTTLLMDRFYGNWRSGMPIGRALQQAQNWLRGKPDHRGESLTSGKAMLDYVDECGILNSFSNGIVREARHNTLKDWASEHPSAPPFGASAYWAAFVATGACW